jgi:hypothetical protein
MSLRLVGHPLPTGLAHPVLGQRTSTNDERQRFISASPKKVRLTCEAEQSRGTLQPLSSAHSLDVAAVRQVI